MTKKNPWWRPSKFSEEKVKKLEEAFALDCTVEEACFYADISKQTYYDWIDKRQELADRFKALRNRPVLMARQEVIKWLKNNPELSLKYSLALILDHKNKFPNQMDLLKG